VPISNGNILAKQVKKLENEEEAKVATLKSLDTQGLISDDEFEAAVNVAADRLSHEIAELTAPTPQPTAAAAPTAPPTMRPTPGTCGDGLQSDDIGETDIDCGGNHCHPCGATQSCVMDTDCYSQRCSGEGVCHSATVAPTAVPTSAPPSATIFTFTGFKKSDFTGDLREALKDAIVQYLVSKGSRLTADDVHLDLPYSTGEYNYYYYYDDHRSNLADGVSTANGNGVEVEVAVEGQSSVNALVAINDNTAAGGENMKLFGSLLGWHLVEHGVVAPFSANLQPVVVNSIRAKRPRENRGAPSVAPTAQLPTTRPTTRPTTLPTTRPTTRAKVEAGPGAASSSASNAGAAPQTHAGTGGGAGSGQGAGGGAGNGGANDQASSEVLPELDASCAEFVDSTCGHAFDGDQYSSCFLCLQNNVIGLITANCPSEVAWICDHMFEIGLEHERGGSEFAEDFFASDLQASTSWQSQMETTETMGASTASAYSRNTAVAIFSGTIVFVGVVAIFVARRQQSMQQARSDDEVGAMQCPGDAGVLHVLTPSAMGDLL
jgi:hypothetical protein